MKPARRARRSYPAEWERLSKPQLYYENIHDIDENFEDYARRHIPNLEEARDAFETPALHAFLPFPRIAYDDVPVLQEIINLPRSRLKQEDVNENRVHPYAYLGRFNVPIDNRGPCVAWVNRQKLLEMRNFIKTLAENEVGFDDYHSKKHD